MEEENKSLDVHPSCSDFMVELKNERKNWYLLGIHLEIPACDLDEISLKETTNGQNFCLAQLYESYRNFNGPVSWKAIVDALGKVGNVRLAVKLAKKYRLPNSLSVNEHPDNPTVKPSIFVDDEAMVAFCDVRARFAELVINVKNALQDQQISLNHLQSFLQDACDSSIQPTDSATFEEVFQIMKQYTSCYNVCLYQNVVRVFLRGDVRVDVDSCIDHYLNTLRKFKESTLMKQIVEDVKQMRSEDEKQQVKLKVSDAWLVATIKEFEKLVNVILHQNKLVGLHVGGGCLSICWKKNMTTERIITDLANSPIFMAAVGIISLTVADGLIYEDQQNQASSDSITSLLIKSFEKGCIDAVEVLIAVGGNPFVMVAGEPLVYQAVAMKSARDERSVLHRASEWGHSDVCSLLVEYCSSYFDIDAQTKIGATALHLSCSHGRHDVASILLKAGADPNLTTKKGFSPLMIASEKGNSYLIELLLCFGAMVTLQNNELLTAFYLACQNGHLSIASTLLSAGADPNLSLCDHTSSLMVASKLGHVEVVKLLISENVDINAQNSKGSTALYLASKFHKSVVASVLLDVGADPNLATIKHGSTPLLIASSNGDLPIVTLLVTSGKVVKNYPNKAGKTALFVACSKRYIEVASVLLEAGANPNIQVFKSGQHHHATPLTVACRNRDEQLVKLLLQHSADPNIATGHGQLTPLIVASWNGSVTILNMLLEKDAELCNKDKNRCSTLELQNIDGCTALHYASLNDHFNCVTTLLSAGANSDPQDYNKVTPLSLASTDGLDEVVAALLKAKANPNLPNSKGLTPFIIACQNGHSKIVTLIKVSNSFQDKDGKMVLGIPLDDQFTALFLASQNGHTEVVSILLAAGVVQNGPSNYDGLTPLMIACLRKHEKITRLLSEKCYDLDKKTVYNETALHFACMSKSVSIASALLGHGANPNVVTKRGATPLMLACASGCKDIVELLIHHPTTDINYVAPSGLTVSMVATDDVKPLLEEMNILYTTTDNDISSLLEVMCTLDSISQRSLSITTTKSHKKRFRFFKLFGKRSKHSNFTDSSSFTSSTINT